MKKPLYITEKNVITPFDFLCRTKMNDAKKISINQLQATKHYNWFHWRGFNANGVITLQAK